MIEAREKLLFVNSRVAGFKATREHILRIDQDVDELMKAREKEKLSKEEREKQLAIKRIYASAEISYQDGLQAFNSRRWEKARSAFEEALARVPGYKNAEVYLKRTEDALAVEAAEKNKLQKDAQGQDVYSLYKEAVQLYKAGDHASALVKFERIEKEYLGYRSTQEYIKTIRQAQVAPVTQEKKDIVQPIVPVIKDAKAIKTELESEVKKEVKKEPAKVVQKEVKAEKKAPVVKPSPVKKVMVQPKKETVEPIVIKPPRKKRMDVAEKQLIGKPAVDIKKEIKVEKKEILIKNEESIPDPKRVVQLDHPRKIHQQVDLLSREAKAASTDKTLSRVDRILADIKAEQRRIASLVQRERPDEIKKEPKIYQIQALPGKQSVRLQNSTEDFFQQGTDALKAGDYELARKKFIEVRRLDPNYRNLDRMFLTLDQQQKESKLQVIEAFDREKIAALALRADQLNQDSYLLSRRGDYQAVQQKFTELEDVLTGMEKVKSRIVNRRSGVKVAKAVKMEKLQAKNALVQKSRILYREGQQHFAAQRFAEAKTKFLEASQADPSFRAPRSYLERIDQILARQDQGQRRIQTEKEVNLNLKNKEILIKNEESRSKSQGVVQSDRPRKIHQQADVLSQDTTAVSAQKTLSRVDRILADIKAEQRRIASLVQRERPEIKNESLVREALASPGKQSVAVENLTEDFFQQGASALKSGDYVVARKKFIEVSRLDPKYRNVERMLLTVEQQQKEAKLQVIEAFDRRKIAGLAVQADQLNQDAYLLSRRGDYQSVQKKFTDLEDVLAEMENVKAGIISRRSGLKTAKDIKQAELKVEEKLVEKSRILYREGQQHYSAERFAEARVKFLESSKADPSFLAPRSYLDRIDRILAKRDYEQSRLQAAEKVEALPEASQRAVVLQNPAVGSAPVAVNAADPGTNVNVAQNRVQAIESKKNLRRIELENRREREKYLLSKRKEDEKARQLQAEERRKYEKIKRSLEYDPLLDRSFSPSTRTGFYSKSSSVRSEYDNRKLEDQRRAIRRDLESGVERMYQDALSLYQRDLFEQARVAFQEVNAVINGYKKTQDYLARIDLKLKTALPSGLIKSSK